MHNFDFAQLTSITNYTNNDYSMSLDADAGATPSTFIGGAAFDFIAVLKNESRQVSQELRLDGTSGPLSWVTGLFYYRDDKSSLQDYVLRSFGVKRLNKGALKTTKTEERRVGIESGSRGRSR